MVPFARGMGFLFLGSGAFLLAFPEAVKRVIKIRSEYGQLSHGALRMLGGLYLTMGGLMVAATSQPTVEIMEVERAEPELRRAA